MSASSTSAEEARQAFLSHLAGRHARPATLEAYGRDVAAFLGFLLGHLGAAPSLGDLAQLEAQDFRAYLAHRRRGEEGLSDRSVSRALSAIRGYFRYLARAYRVR
ncbi:MAG: site-specific integrase, partial [Caulobacterales bacterium]|nr:site-specific integrase [Caulobacterales bacterium]